jgi:hypothetical protein
MYCDYRRPQISDQICFELSFATYTHTDISPCAMVAATKSSALDLCMGQFVGHKT